MATFRNCRVLFLLILFLGTTGIARADSTFNFNSDTVGTVTPFTDTNNGISATFTSAAPFVIESNSFAAPMSGNVLIDAPTDVLNVAFSANLDSASLNYAQDAVAGSLGTFTIEEFEGATLVGSATNTGAVPAGYSFEQGSITLAGPTFNNIEIYATGGIAPLFAIDNLDVSPATVPEPSTMLLLGMGLLGLGGTMRRKFFS